FPCTGLWQSLCLSAQRICFAITGRLAQDGLHVVVSSQKQQNSAATLQGEGFSAEDPERLVDMTLDINVKAPALMTKAVWYSCPLVAAFSPSPGFSPYNVSKTALLGLTKTLAIALAPRNIRVNCLAPGLITTCLCSVLCKDKEKEERMKETLQITRLGESEDYAGIVSFLCSEDASYITEETVVVGGGTPSRL
uniref:Dehydrogenase/reductase 2 n=1 Tax=Rhinopithecus roxellana TaxID=61622 RepID=A0A2K6NIQ6_RHIRO